MSSGRHAIVVSPEQGLGLWSARDLITLKVRETHTAADFVFAELQVLPGGGPPPHIHLREDELFYVLEGEITFVLEDKTFTAGPGAAVFLPRGKVHTFANRSARPARALLWASHCNFERFMLEFGVPVTESPQPPAPDAAMMARLSRAAERYGLLVLPQHEPTWTMEPPTASEALPVLGMSIAMLLDGSRTHKGACLTELEARPGTGVVPHLHREEDELFYVLDGEFEIEVDGTSHPAPQGTTVYVPRGTFHAFLNVGCTTGRLLSLHTPAGFEHFIEEMSGYSQRGMEIPESDLLVQLLDRHGMDVPAELAMVA